MKAKKMFEKLGYKEIDVNTEYIIEKEKYNPTKKCIKAYEHYSEKYFDYTYILFFEDNTLLKYNYSHQSICYITFEEYKAIQKQIEELGWLD